MASRPPVQNKGANTLVLTYDCARHPQLWRDKSKALSGRRSNRSSILHDSYRFPLMFQLSRREFHLAVRLKDPLQSWLESVWRLFSVALGCVTLAAKCTPLGSYHRNTADRPNESIAFRNGYSLAFVEFGEQGSCQDVSQLQRLEDLIKRAARPLVVTYVHGWHNNAESADVDRFSGLLAELSKSASVRRSNYHVLGVYIGWRREITNLPLITELSFWNRKAAAERLASNFDLYTAVASIATRRGSSTKINNIRSFLDIPLAA
jgi:hypothetical protein